MNTQTPNASTRIMWIEDNIGLCIALVLFVWIVAGVVVAAARNTIDEDCATDGTAMLGLRVLIWPLELFIFFIQLLTLFVGGIAIAIVRLLTCKF